ncbi:MAG TPA: PAS domain S-box protein [Candidatus Eisenbacteria bacterium]|nr:PAS domain S-box protein [Candidatus Eisenbacteria bacterium]
MTESSPGGSAFHPQVFGLVFEAHPHAMLVVEPATTKVLLANPAAGSLLGCSARDLIGRSVGELKPRTVAPGPHRGPPPTSHDVCRGGVWRFPRADGSYVDLECLSTEIHVDGKPATLFVGADVTQREKVALDARNREQLLSAAIEHLPGCIVAIDQHGVIIGFNKAAERTFKRAERDVLRRDMADIIIPPEDRERHRRGLAHYLETGEKHIIGRAIEMPAMRADGSTFWAEILVSVAHLEGNKSAFVAYIRDLTESKRVERQLAIQQALGRVLAEDSPVPATTREVLQAVCEYGNWDVGLAWMLDDSGELLHFMDAWQSRKDVASFVDLSRGLKFPSGKGLPGRVWEKRRPHWILDISVDPNFPRSRVAVESKIRSGFAFPVRADRHIIGVIEFFSRERREPDEELEETFLSVGQRLGHFIERKQKAEKLRETNEMLKTLLHASPLAIIQIDHGFIVRFWNAAAERMFGWTEREMIGKPYPVVVPAEKRTEFTKLCQRLFAGEELRGVDTYRKRKDGSRVDIFLNVAPLRDRDGKITSLLGVIAESPKPSPPGPRIRKPAS